MQSLHCMEISAFSLFSLFGLVNCLLVNILKRMTKQRRTKRLQNGRQNLYSNSLKCKF